MDNWFETWFDSYHYHLLYQNRDYSEAEAFIKLLFKHLKPDRKNARILDLACGKGRHSIQINGLGYQVQGIDLSESSIKAAKEFENSNLSFSTGDMRYFNGNLPFDLVLNLFTSFGYFKDDEENLLVIKNISNNLKPGGKLVLDYLNSKMIVSQLPQSDQITRDGIQFHIEKFIEGNFIVKKIAFEEHGKSYSFREFVRTIDLSNFENYFKQAGLCLINTFGDYDLQDFDENKSPRLILIAEKAN